MYYMSIAIACGVDVCTVHHQTFKKIHICINIHYPHTISLTYINYIFFERPSPSSAGGVVQTSFPRIQTEHLHLHVYCNCMWDRYLHIRKEAIQLGYKRKKV